jgi:hypothetical protein
MERSSGLAGFGEYGVGQPSRWFIKEHGITRRISGRAECHPITVESNRQHGPFAASLRDRLRRQIDLPLAEQRKDAL